MKVSIINFPDSDGFEDLVELFDQNLDYQPEIVWHKDNISEAKELIAIPGRELYGDSFSKRSLLLHSPVMNDIIELAGKSSLVIGFGNGFRMLCELGLLPGKLLVNKAGYYISKNVFVKADNNNTVFSCLVSKHQPLRLPLSCHYGRYYADEETLVEMRQKDQILFRFCDGNGKISEKYNPTGSIENIAGVCNRTKNVFGLLPHPERATEKNIR
jgi:phosphoribosylformylglycinamidine synthase subunit PurQ / glutaminase